MPTIAIDGVCEVNFVRTGPRGGVPFLFVHGVGLDLTWWGAQVEDFGRDRDVVALDLPGHGLSGAMVRPPGFEVMTSVIERVIVELDGGPVHLVGISFGGMIAQTLALQRPDLVRSLTLVATMCTFPEPVRGALRERARVARSEGMSKIAQLSNERWFPPHFRERRPDLLDRATRNLLAQDPEFHASIWELIAGLDLEAQLPAISAPTLVIVGAEDINAPLSAGRLIADRIAGAELHEMIGLGHFPPFETPEPFNALLRDFLKRRAVDQI
ncbi:alpha/beta fold hydrolase [Rhizobium tumorigenes]|uniref:alpha/beta fold hydrolase n=1 Tax=Rhizobium tumorigenes TaxID=2041385 RepID=UPI002420091C|nr:alpha/beta hydrolase [Rhizobium tumorigenes]WFS03404.1 alpha/beta hydrolase [Rhizobium tumorigenes]